MNKKPETNNCWKHINSNVIEIRNSKRNYKQKMLPMQQQEKHILLQAGWDHYIFHKLRKQKNLKSSIILLLKANFYQSYEVCSM